MNQAFAQISSIANDPLLGSIFMGAKWIFIILNAALLALFLYALWKAWAYRINFYFPLKKRIVQTKQKRSRMAFGEWRKIQKRIEDASDQSLTIAVIEADKLTDEILRQEGFGGEYMAGRLDNVGRARKMKTIENVWKAHRIRNNLVHAPGFKLSRNQAEEIVGDYEAFLKELGVL